jgi:hypothetical protein
MPRAQVFVMIRDRREQPPARQGRGRCCDRHVVLANRHDPLRDLSRDGAGARTISLPRWKGKSTVAADDFVEHALPNFLFLVTTAYAIVRHDGVDVGKGDFLGPLTLR